MSSSSHSKRPPTLIKLCQRWIRKRLRQTQTYRFVSCWELPGDIHEVATVLLDTKRLPAWWPAAFLKTEVRTPGDQHAVGRCFDLLTKGWLPYTMRFRMQLRNVQYPHFFCLESSGDFVGRGTARLIQKESHVEVHFDWRVRVRKPLLKFLSPFLRPVLVTNHRWAMALGQESLRRELILRYRRRQRGEPIPTSHRLVSILGFRVSWPTYVVQAIWPVG